MPDVSVDTGIVDIPAAADLARGAVFLEGPEGLLTSWLLIGAFVIVTSSIGIVGTLLLLPLVVGMLFVGFAWLAWREVR